MILIADSGSTKTTWAIINSDGSTGEKCHTPGINPFLQTKNEIYDCLRNEFSSVDGPYDVIWFYGAGCANPEKKDKVQRALDKFFNAGKILVDSDLMAAARSLCGTSPGIVAIIGTGSNSCYYDGTIIKRHVPPLGYILGDEGSGTVLGKKLLADILKNQLPEKICSAFFEKYQMKPDEIMDKVYRRAFPNRFMANFTFFIAENIDHPAIFNLVKTSFAEFFDRNVSQYPESGHLPVSVTGSIGWHFKEILREAADEAGIHIGTITESPMKGLLDYHKNQIQH